MRAHYVFGGRGLTANAYVRSSLFSAYAKLALEGVLTNTTNSRQLIENPLQIIEIEFLNVWNNGV